MWEEAIVGRPNTIAVEFRFFRSIRNDRGLCRSSPQEGAAGCRHAGKDHQTSDELERSADRIIRAPDASSWK